jgi:mono/diheme cytochrome c family protein
MPGFGDSLSDEEIRDVLAYIRSTWPDQVQDVQAARSHVPDEN